MKPIFAIFFGLLIAGGAYADDAPSVIERTDCTALKEKIDSLSADADADLREELNATYRRDCASRARGRMTSGRVATATASATGSVAAAAVVVTPAGADGIVDAFMKRRDENCKTLDNEYTKMSALSDEESIDGAKKLKNLYNAACGDISDFDVIDPAVAAKNIEAGLCADGSQPNKFGCCVGEIFKDLGGGEFGCCPKSGGECMPPIK